MTRLFLASLAAAAACLSTSTFAAHYTIVVQGDTIRGTLKEQLESEVVATLFGDYGFKIPENHHKASTFIGAKYRARVTSTVYLPTTGLAPFDGNAVRHGAEARLILNSRSTDNLAHKTEELLHEADNVVVNKTATLNWSTAVATAEDFMVEWRYILRPLMDAWVETNPKNGVYRYELAHQAQFVFDGDQNDLLLKCSDWFDNVYQDTFDAIKETVRKELQGDKSQHVKEERRKIKWSPAATGVRASADALGISIRTASPGFATYRFTLPSAGSLSIPVVFLANPDAATVTVAFNGQVLGSFAGTDFAVDELASLTVDISSKHGQTGDLKITIDSDSANSSRIFIPDLIEGYVDLNRSTIPARSAVSSSGSSVAVETHESFEYELHRSTDLIESTVVETKIGNGEEVTFDFDLFEGIDKAVYYWVKTTAPDFAPAAMPTGSVFTVSPEYSSLAVLAGDAFRLDLAEDGIIEGTFTYEKLSASESAFAAVVPSDTSLNTVFTLLWETPTSGSISATGALNYGYSAGIKFSFAPGAE